MTTTSLCSRKRRAVCAADLLYFWPISFRTGLVKKSLRPSAKGPPGLVLHAVLFHVLVRGLLLMEDVGLHLVDRRGDFGELAQVDQAVGIKVADADGAQLASPVSLLHGAVGAE